MLPGSTFYTNAPYIHPLQWAHKHTPICQPTILQSNILQTVHTLCYDSWSVGGTIAHIHHPSAPGIWHNWKRRGASLLITWFDFTFRKGLSFESACFWCNQQFILYCSISERKCFSFIVRRKNTFGIKIFCGQYSLQNTNLKKTFPQRHKWGESILKRWGRTFSSTPVLTGTWDHSPPTSAC